MAAKILCGLACVALFGVSDAQTVQGVPAGTNILSGVYVQAGRRAGGANYAQVGVTSYHFDKPGDMYIHCCNQHQQWKLANGKEPPPRKTFLNPTWNQQTRTFSGTVDWTKDEHGHGSTNFEGDVKWEYTMVFNTAFTEITGGAVKMTTVTGRKISQPFTQRTKKTVTATCRTTTTTTTVATTTSTTTTATVTTTTTALAEITLVRVKQKSSGLKNTFLNMYSTFDPNKFK